MKSSIFSFFFSFLGNWLTRVQKRYNVNRTQDHCKIQKEDFGDNGHVLNAVNYRNKYLYQRWRQESWIHFCSTFIFMNNSVCYKMSVVFLPYESYELHLGNKINLLFLPCYCRIQIYIFTFKVKSICWYIFSFHLGILKVM